ncbi:FkbM family methyltransferase [Larkinella bovis]|uniref:FkbM family methyltransferase n=1 Tax=Larkinella bovis TaxID=683041 RepID=A0ABW0IHL2_9BACT
MVSNLKALFESYPFLTAIRYGLATFARRFFDPAVRLSYSQVGEDRLLMVLLGEPKTGFYVEVGSNDPVNFSNTFSFYRMGWRGITIDANEALVEKHKKLRKRDIPVYAAVSDVEEEVVFTEYSLHELSTINPIMKERRLANSAQVIGEKKLRTVTLTTILDQYLSPGITIDFLSIDVEGHDFNVLRSLDLSRYRPRLIVIEMHNFQMKSYSNDVIYQYLTSHGYVFIGYAVWNGYFADQDYLTSKSQ